MKKLYKIKLDQFPTNYKTCVWIQGLISLSTDFFQKTTVINGVLLLEGGDESDLEHLNEASSVDFTYFMGNETIREIEILV